MFQFVYKELDLAHKLDAPSRPSESYYKHIHHFYEVIYFVKGDVRYTVDSATKPLDEGDVVLIPSGKYHFATVNSDVAYERFVFKFPADLLPEFLREALKKHGPFFRTQNKYSLLFTQFENCMDTYTDEEIYTLFLCDITKLLLELCHQSDEPAVKTKPIVAKIVRFIDENIYSPLTLDVIVDNLKYSKSYIVREFKKNMNISLIQYVNTKKIYLAYLMILKGEKTFVVAQTLGYDDYSTFYRCYKKIMGHSPGEVKDKVVPSHVINVK